MCLVDVTGYMSTYIQYSHEQILNTTLTICYGLVRWTETEGMIDKEQNSKKIS